MPPSAFLPLRRALALSLTGCFRGAREGQEMHSAGFWHGISVGENFFAIGMTCQDGIAEFAECAKRFEVLPKRLVPERLRFCFGVRETVVCATHAHVQIIRVAWRKGQSWRGRA